MKTRLVILLNILLLVSLAQKVSYELNWGELTEIIPNKEIQYSLENSYFNTEDNCLHFVQTRSFMGKKKVSLESISFTSETIESSSIPLETLNKLKDKPTYTFQVNQSDNQTISKIDILPYFVKDGALKRVTNVHCSLLSSTLPTPKKNFYKTTQNSNLSNETSFKFAITKSGVHKLSYEDLKDAGIINGSIAPNTIHVYGNKGTANQFLNSDYKPGDVQEISIKVNSVSPNKFEKGDFIYFYAEASGNWEFESSDSSFIWQKDYYTDTNFVFVQINSNNPQHIDSVDHTNMVTLNTAYYNHSKEYHETDHFNFIHSGRDWVGENFQDSNYISFTISTESVPKNAEFNLKFKPFVRSERKHYSDPPHFTYIKAALNGDTIGYTTHSTVSSTYYEDFALPVLGEFKDTLKEGKIDLSFKFNRHYPEDQAWLDYFSFDWKERLSYKNKLIEVQVPSFNGAGITEYNVLSSNNQLQIWNVTNYNKVFSVQSLKNDSGVVFKDYNDSTAKYIVFTEQDFLTPKFIKSVAPQNLHGLSSYNYLIISPEALIQQGQRLVDLHSKKDGLTGIVINTEHIYNEFGSGRRSAPALRDFIKHLYEKGTNSTDSLKYVLLLGEGSYDLKNVESGNFEFIPTYQSVNSVGLINSYVSDDFFGLLNTNEGEYINGDLLDVAIGRIPANSVNEAKIVVDKVYEYYNTHMTENSLLYDNPNNSLGGWTNSITFVGDDEDQNIHMRQSNDLATLVDTAIKEFNINKIFLDAYLQETTISGTDNPTANRALMSAIDEGSLIINYTGHGGEKGWTDEHLLRNSDIFGMTNRYRLPLFMTATCEFSRHDLPSLRSAGENLLLKPKGGALALFSTVRLVFSIPNFDLNKTFYNVLKNDIHKEGIKLGDLFLKTKVGFPTKNSRNFTLLGDPAISLNFAKNKVLIDSILYNNSKTDTLLSLQKATIVGHINNSSNLKDPEFNGEIEIKVFDKPRHIVALNNDNEKNTFEFDVQNKLLFKGIATVKNGVFNAPIILPFNTDPQYGFGKISFFAISDDMKTANGDNRSIIMAADTNNVIDKTGPEVKLFLNDSTFSFGDVVAPSPLFIAELKDSSGINIVTNEIGRDITLKLDGDNLTVYKLNNYYQNKPGNIEEGIVKYQLGDLKNGTHSLELNAWDNANNSTKAYTEFIIETNADLALNHVLNYPNPFTTQTGFYFEHNQFSGDLEVTIHVLTISGKIVKTIQGIYDATNKRIGPISWNGLDEFGDKIGKGVYVYQINVKKENGQEVKALEKLVILK